jgi:hypothetical protein
VLEHCELPLDVTLLLSHSHLSADEEYELYRQEKSGTSEPISNSISPFDTAFHGVDRDEGPTNAAASSHPRPDSTDRLPMSPPQRAIGRVSDMEPLKLTLRHAKEAKNTARYEAPKSETVTTTTAASQR